MRFLGFACLALAILAGCSGTKAILVDSASLQTPVRKLRIRNRDNVLYFIESEGERHIPLGRVSWVKISPRTVKNRNGKTFFLTEAELKDGSKIMSYRLKDGRKSQAFLCVDDTLMAKTRNGTMQVKLSNITKISFE